MADEIEMIGEVIESSTQEFVAESKELHSPPPFGSFVRVGVSGADASLPLAQDEDPFDSFRSAAGSFNSGYHSTVSGEASEGDQPNAGPATYAIVYQATTTPVDTGRKLRAYWKDEEQLREEQPELSEWLLVTNFRAVIIGHCTNGMMCQFLPPQPPKLLTRVHICRPDEIRRLTSRMDFLRTLTNFRNAPTEEVIAACIREAYIAHDQNFDFLVAAGKELAGLLKDDYDRLQAIMRRVAP
jgi:hypothetical protein